MLIIGELLNASRKTVAAAIEARDISAIQKIARDQADAGADYIDVKNGITIEIKKRFDEEGIEIPFPHRTIYTGDATKPFPILQGE